MPDEDEIPFERREAVEHTPPKCEIKHREICLLEETREILLLNKRYQMVSIYLFLIANEILPVNPVVDTGAGPRPI